MNVFFLVYDITKSAGTERAVCNLANILSVKYEVSIISISSNGGTVYYQLNQSVNIIHLGIDNTVHNVVRKLFAYWAVYKKMQQIVSAGSIIVGTDVPYNAIIAKFKHCHTVGCSHMGGKAHFNMRGFIRFFSYRKLDVLVVLTDADLKNYRHLKKVEVIPNSLSFKPTKILDYSKKNVLAIGRLTAQKGFDMLIDIANIVAEKAPDWTFTICGTGELKEALLVKIKKLHLENTVHIIEPTKDVISLYHSSSIYVMPSRFEGLPMVLIESQACGLPIVSFDCPEGPSSIVNDGDDGFLIEPNDIVAFAEKLLCLMNDENKRKQFGEVAFKNSERFSPERIGKMWFDLFEKMEGEKV